MDPLPALQEAEATKPFASSITTSPVSPTASANLTPSEASIPVSEPILSEPLAPIPATTTAPIPDFAVQEPVTAITKIGDLQSLGLGNNTPAGLAEQLLEFVYVNTGLPWWGTIVCTTLIIRIGLFPLTLRTQRNLARLSYVTPHMQGLQNEMQAARARADIEGMRAASLKTMELYKEHKVSPFSPFVAFMQAPFFMSFFFALKWMAEAKVPGFMTEGLPWALDLTARDPLWILPMMGTLGILATLELGAESAGQNKLKDSRFKTVFRTLLVFSLPLTAYLPAGIFCYWVTSNAFSLLQGMAFKQPAVKNFFGIPPMYRPDAAPTPTIQGGGRLDPLQSVFRDANAIRMKKMQDDAAAAERIKQKIQ
ncbi:Mitochondrial inner membrane protein oxa1l [Rhizophlyctis rosea]|uniref:Mitochondrial inner membrane protein oxa1l n=1 Tax=Rhizophlyctis rosea TaxID=64517 RepID=A0AAD5SE67_9FUNG|nr:Mitochondrial inner membrane protein oxa1l [Rhizophlyctis rosea]